jgi:hypothetical protein
MYFKRFPKINYNNHEVVNILTRVKLLDTVKDNTTIFLPYTIEEGERPDMVADFYYDDPRYNWLVLLSNQVIDPYYEWPLTTFQFQEFIKKKYGSLAGAQSQILHYKHNSKDIKITPDTYTLMTGGHASYTAVTAYDKENDDNESRRSIFLIDKSFKTIARSDLKRILNGD